MKDNPQSGATVSNEGIGKAGVHDSSGVKTPETKTQKIQREINSKIERLRSLEPNAFVAFALDPIFKNLKFDNYNSENSEDIRRAISRLDELLAPLELKELAKSAESLIKEFELRVKQSNDPVDILDLGRDEVTTENTVKFKHRELVRQYSVDSFDRLSRSSEDKYNTLYSQLTEILKKINLAKEIILDQNKQEGVGNSDHSSERRQASAPSNNRHEDKNELSDLALQRELKNVESIYEICEILEILASRNFEFVATKGETVVIRKPGEILSLIRKSQKLAETGSVNQLIESLFLITSLQGIQSKVLKELTPKLVSKLKRNRWTSLKEILNVFQALSELDFKIPVEKNNRHEYRYPKDILQSVERVQAVSDNPDSVHELIESRSVTTLFDIDIRLYKSIRDSWSWMKKIRHPVPDSIKARLEMLES